MRRMLAIMILLLGADAFAQQTISAATETTGSNTRSDLHGIAVEMIDGELHPELIPDSTAYRLFFVVAGQLPNPTDEQRAIQRGHIRKVHLSASGEQQLAGVLEEFKIKYAALIERYNDTTQVILANGGTPDYKAFVVEREALVGLTRERLGGVLSDADASQFNAFIQTEKKRMKISAGSDPTP